MLRKPKDFNINDHYWARWKCEKEDCTVKVEGVNHYHYYRCNVLLLGESYNDLEYKISLSRIKFSSANKELTNSTFPDTEESEIEPVQKMINQNDDHDADDGGGGDGGDDPYNGFSENEDDDDGDGDGVGDKNLNEFLKSRTSLGSSKPDGRMAVSSDSDDLDIHLNNERSREHENCQKPDATINSKENDVGTFSAKSTTNSTTVSRKRKALQEANSVSFTIKKKFFNVKQKENIKLDIHGIRYQHTDEEGKINIGLDIYIDKECWEMLKLEKNIWIFMRDLADRIWGTTKLVNRTFDLKHCKKKINPDSPRKKLESDKLRLLV
uniref:Uncharacterized protein n=1 Tax=Trichogramma kaykai TaxID=54128 RepID=A0ABD2XFZ6_9HYME